MHFEPYSSQSFTDAQIETSKCRAFYTKIKNNCYVFYFVPIMRILRVLKRRGQFLLRGREVSTIFRCSSHNEANNNNNNSSSSSKEIRRIVSGIQPTGTMHLGNYLGAIKKWVELQNTCQAEILYGIVDLHSITMPQDPEELKQSVKNMAISLLACGVNPDRSIIFKQSEVTQHAELAWILSCITPLGILNRMHQWKSKTEGSKEQQCLGLYAYPVLMAADILLYRASHVPVGDDQLQHLELARELARIFNNSYGKFFSSPQPILGEMTRVMSLRDATKKMSKSDPNHLSRIELSDNSDTINSKIKKSITDSDNHISYDPEGRPGVSNLIDIYCALSEETIETVCSRYHSIERFKSVFKKDLTDLIVEKLSPIRQEIEKLTEQDSYVEEILQKGAAKASELASVTLNDVKILIGFK